MFYRLLFLFTILSAGISCNSALDKKYNPETFTEDAAAIRESNKLSEEDAQLLAKYLLLARLNGRSLEDKTYRNILEDAKRIEHADAEVARILVDEKDKAKRLDSLLKVTVTRKYLSEKPGDKQIILVISFDNKKGKGIRKLTGTLIFRDQLNIEMRSVPVDIQKPIKAAGITVLEQAIAFSDYIEDDSKFNTTALQDFKISWIADKIFYADGTILD